MTRFYQSHKKKFLLSHFFSSDDVTRDFFCNNSFDVKTIKFNKFWTRHNSITRFFYKQHSYQQRQTQIMETSATPWGWAFVIWKNIHVLHPCYHSRITRHILWGERRSTLFLMIVCNSISSPSEWWAGVLQSIFTSLFARAKLRFSGTYLHLTTVWCYYTCLLKFNFGLR